VALKLIRIELARTPEFPEGSPSHGYEFVAPLRQDGHIDLEEWKRYGQACTVTRFWGGQDNEHGILVRAPGDRWAFSYRPGETDDEPIQRFASHAFRAGEYVTITEHDGVARPFRVVSLGDPPALKRV
jgi:hypothetical protein